MLSNFIKTITRFKTATALNIIGLSTAFIAFIVIILQVSVEYSFDTTYKDSDKIFRVEHLYESDMNNGIWNISLSRPAITDIINNSPDITQYAIKSYSSKVFEETKFKFETPANDGPIFVSSATAISTSFIDMFDIQIIEGSFDGKDPNSVLIPESVAAMYPGGKSAVGQILKVTEGSLGIVSRPSLTVSGVYRKRDANTSFSDEIYINAAEIEIDSRNNSGFDLYIKLNSKESASAVTKLVADQLLKDTPEEMRKRYKYRLKPIHDIYFTQDVQYVGGGSAERTAIFTLIAILTLVIASINYINFSTALVPIRIKGINTRKVFGATNLSIRLQMVVESVGLSLIAYLIALFVVGSFGTLDSISFIEPRIIITEHIPTLLWTGVVAMVVGVVAGLYPAFYSTSFPTALVLKGSFGLSPLGKRLRSALVGFQYVISIALIIAAMFMNMQYSFIRNTEMGFERENILNISINKKINESRQVFIDALNANSDIHDITITRRPFFSNKYAKWGRMYRDSVVAFENIDASSRFAKFFGVKIIEGSDFNELDDTQDSVYKIIFNRTAQQKYGFRIGDEVAGYKITGIMEDFNYKPLHTKIEPFALVSLGFPKYSSSANVYVKCQSRDYAALIDYIRTAGRNIDPDWSADISFIDERIEHLYQKDSRATVMISFFSMLAIVISLLGVFGLVIFETQFRRKEIGLRKIHGATISSVLVMFNRRFVWIVAICFVIAAPVAWYGITQWLSGFAFRTPLHWWVFAVAPMIVLLITILTVTIQSWKAATENPVNSLKSE